MSFLVLTTNTQFTAIPTILVFLFSLFQTAAQCVLFQSFCCAGNSSSMASNLKQPSQKTTFSHIITDFSEGPHRQCWGCTSCAHMVTGSHASDL